MQKYNIYLHTDKKLSGNHNNPTFWVDFSCLDESYDFYNLDVYFYQSGNTGKDYIDAGKTTASFTVLYLNAIKVSSSLLDICSYDSNSNTNTFSLGYALKTENYADNTVSKGSQFVFKFENKTILRPNSQMVTFLVQNLYALMKKDNLYTNLNPNYIYKDITLPGLKNDTTPWEIVLQLTPIK